MTATSTAYQSGPATSDSGVKVSGCVLLGGADLAQWFNRELTWSF